MTKIKEAAVLASLSGCETWPHTFRVLKNRVLARIFGQKGVALQEWV